MAHQIMKTKKADLAWQKLTTESIFLQLSLQTSLILADKGSPFGLDDNKLSIKLQTATQIIPLYGIIRPYKGLYVCKSWQCVLGVPLAARLWSYKGKG